MNGEDIQAEFHRTTSSLKELLQGKKIIKKLPENYYEKLHQLESKLKSKFNISTLQEIIKIYSLGIEYYESIDNEKFKELRANLNVLLSEPEIIKQLKHFNKNNKTYSSNYSKQIKKNIQLSILKLGNIAEKETEKLEQDLSSNQFDEMLSKEMQSQSENFKANLQKKKQKQLLSRSDINKDESVTTQSKHIRNQSVGFKFASEDSLFHVNTNEHSLNNSFEREFRFIKEDEYSTGDTTIKSVKINKNHLLKDIGNSIDIFVSEMNQYFTQEIVACQMEEIEKLMQQKSDEIMEINMSYLAKEFELKQKNRKRSKSR